MSLDRVPERAGDAAAGPAVFALAADLMFASRIRATAEACGVPVKLVRNAAVLEAEVAAAGGALVLLDLEARGLAPHALIPALRASGAEVVGFVSHVRADLIAAARAAGADRVLARSAFVQELPRLLARDGAVD